MPPLHFSQGVYPTVAAPPVGTYGDDFDDAGTARLGILQRSSSGTEPGVIYDWDYDYVVRGFGNLLDDNLVWLPSDRSGIQREVFLQGSTPAVNYMAPFDLGQAHWASCVRDSSSTTINFGPSIGCAAAASDIIAGVVHITAGNTTGFTSSVIEQFVNDNGGRQLLGRMGPAPEGSVLRLEYDPVGIGVDTVRAYPNYVDDPGNFVDLATIIPIAGNYAGIAARHGASGSGPTIYRNFRCGSL